MKTTLSEFTLPVILDPEARWARTCVDGFFAGPAAAERSTHAEISYRAHSMWECAGRPENCQLAHWLAAEAEVLAER